MALNYVVSMKIYYMFLIKTLSVILQITWLCVYPITRTRGTIFSDTRDKDEEMRQSLSFLRVLRYNINFIYFYRNEISYGHIIKKHIFYKRENYPHRDIYTPRCIRHCVRTPLIFIT